VQRLSTSDFDSPGDLLGTPGSEPCRSHFSDTDEPVVMLTRNPERQGGQPLLPILKSLV